MANTSEVTENRLAGSNEPWVWIAVNLVMALVIVVMIQIAIIYLKRRILVPLSETAITMTRMADGDLDAGRTSNHRDDEIGQMTRSIEVFRAAAKGKVEAEARQLAVVEAMSAGLSELAKGNLNYRIQTPLAQEYEELRGAYNSTVEELECLIGSVTTSAKGVATGAGEISVASDDLAVRNERQATSLEETAAAMNSIIGIVRETAEAAVKVRSSVEEAHGEAAQGGRVVANAIEAMSAIEHSSQEISQIINVIDGIAFQTNLLALNAGVEAARAGDAGKRFAVVANEVRALAQRSADAARDIKALITTSTEQVSGGVSLVGDTGSLLERIVGMVGEVNVMASDIARATETQSMNLEQINLSIGEMDRMTQQNAAMVEESTAAARSLAKEAGELDHLVSRFQTSGNVVAVPAFADARKRQRTRRGSPGSAGNLALKASPAVAEGDWTEF